MSVEFDIEINQEDVEQLPHDLRIAVSRFLQLTSIDYESRLGEEAPTHEGALRGSFQHAEIDETAWRVWSDLAYAGTIAYGSGPLEPNWGDIVNWAEKKGLPPFPIFYKITTEGVDANPYHERARRTTESNLDSFIDIALSEVRD